MSSHKFQVCSQKCSECLFTKNKIVSDDRRKEIIDECLKLANETFFECHKATLQNKHVCCKGFYDTYGDRVTIIQLAERLNFIDFIDIEGEIKT